MRISSRPRYNGRRLYTVSLVLQTLLALLSKLAKASFHVICDKCANPGKSQGSASAYDFFHYIKAIVVILMANEHFLSYK
jgi:hypothetical protein